MSLTSVLLPLPLTPVTATKQPSGKSTSMCCRLCSCASRTVIHASPGRAADLGDRDRALPREVLAGDRPRLGEQLLQRAGDDDLAAVLACARTDVDDVVGRRGSSLRRARRRSPCCRCRAAARACRSGAGCRAGGGRSRVRRARRARRRGRCRSAMPGGCVAPRPPASVADGAVEGEVVEADVEQEPQTLVHLLLDALGDHPVALGEVERPEEPARPCGSRARRPRRCSCRRSVTASDAGRSRAPLHAGHGTSRM